MKLEFEESDNIWAPISDLMAGLMMVFILISISYMVKSRSAAVIYSNTQTKLIEKLKDEFKSDFDRWNAKLIDSTLSIQFLSDEKTINGFDKILFERGSYEISPWFKSNLDEFFPKFLNIIYSEEFKGIIEEIRIEGHTSTTGLKNNKGNPYFFNMELSQNRSRNVLKYCFDNFTDKNQKIWMIDKVTANGLSYSKKILNQDGTENLKSSRRVEFRIKTNSESILKKILN